MADEQYTSEYGDALNPQPHPNTSSAVQPDLPPPPPPTLPSTPTMYPSSYGATVYPSEPDKRRQNQVTAYSYSPPNPVYQTPPTDTYAIIAFVCGISSLFIGVTAILGVIFGHLAMKRINRTGYQGKGLAIAGLVIGYVSIAFGILIILFYILIFALYAASGSYTY